MDIVWYFCLSSAAAFVLSVVYFFFDITSVTMSSLAGKHVVVTGGSSGIGKSAAIAAAKRGADVTIIARNEEKLQEAKQAIMKSLSETSGQKVNILACDVTQSYEVIEAAISKLEADSGPIYMFINCAGSAQCATVEDASEANFRKMIDLNLMGTVLPTKAVLKGMKTRGEGVVVVTASLAALLGIYGMSAYCASKWALRGFAESLQQEITPFNISVTLCLPPDTDTPGFENENKDKPEETKQICSSGGLFDPEVVAEKLLSDALKGRFWSTVGLDNVMLTLGCAGFSPLSSVAEVFLQIAMSSLVRVVSIFHLRGIQSIVSALHAQKPIAKKTE